MSNKPSQVTAAIAATRSVLLPQILDVQDLAKWLRCSEPTVRALLRAGRLPGRRIGRRWLVSRDALLSFLERPEPKARLLE